MAGLLFVSIVSPAWAANPQFYRVPLNPTATQAGGGLSVTPSALAFEPIPATSSTQGAVTLRNTQLNDMYLTGIQMAGDGFAATDNCPQVLAPNQACQVQVSFSPANVGAHQGTLSVESSLGKTTVAVDVRGTATAGSLEVSPTTLTAPAPVQTGETGSAVLVSVHNTGVARVSTLKLNRSNIGSQFDVQSLCPAELAAGAVCHISVALKPSAAGTPSGSFVIESDAVTGPQTVAFSGDARGPLAELGAPAFAAAQLGTASEGTAVLRNTGVGTMTVGIPSVSGAEFSKVSTTCEATLVAGSACSVVLRFTPAASGQRTGSLVIPTQAGDKSVQLASTGTAAILGLDTGSLSFGTKAVASTSTSATVTLSNTGTAPAAGLALQPNSSAYTVVNSSCGTSLDVGQACSFALQFTPPAAASYDALLNVTTTSPGVAGRAIALSGTGASPSLSVATVSFGTVASGSSSTLTSTVQNTGLVPVTVGTPTVSGTDFSYVSTTCATLQPNGTCLVYAKFAPTGGGNRTGTVTVPFEGKTVSGTLSGTGAVGNVVVSPASLSFASNVGASAGYQYFTVSNNGSSPVAFSSVSSGSGEFPVSNGCGTLQVGSTCSIGVAFTPSAVGTRNGTLTLSHNGTGTSSVPLYGTGTQGVISISPSLVNLGTVNVGSSSGWQGLSVYNSGNGPVTFSNVYSDNGEFQVSNTCGTVQPGNSCIVYVAFSPSYSGYRSANLVMLHNGSGGASYASLYGTGNALVSQFSVSPASLAWGTQNIGSPSSANVTVTNTGNVALSMSAGITAGGSDFTASSSCGYLAAGASCTVTTTFSPAAAGARYGTLTVGASGLASKTVSLSGTGATPPPVASYSPGNGGSVYVQLHDGDSVYDEVIGYVTVRNAGGSAMTLSWSNTAGNLFNISGCPASLVAGQQCTLAVRFNQGWGGGTEGSRTDYLYLNSNGGAATITIRSTYLWN